MDAQTIKSHRRTFLAASAVVAATSLDAWGRAARAAIVDAAGAKIAAQRQRLTRVRVEMDVKGNVKVAKNPLASTQVSNTFPIRSAATLDYEERALAPPNAAESSETVASQRYYHEASSESVLNKTSSSRKLRPEMRLAMVRRDTFPETIYSADNYFTHEELSLLRSPISSLSVDRFLPSQAIMQGDRFEIDADALCSVLNLSSVDEGKVESSVAEISADAVRFRLEGDIQGSVEGVNTRLRLLGKMTFDRTLRTCTWLALAIHETRDISRAEPGFDVSATIKMVRRPLDQPIALPARSPQTDLLAAIPRDRMYVELRSRYVAVGTMMDRRWRMIDDRPGTAILRMIDHDISIAQCNLRPLVGLPEGQSLTRAKFESSVRTTLGDQLRQLIEGEERTTAQGLTVLRVVADGETQGVPIRWIMMHFADESGRRVQATFTMSADQIESFAGSDAQFADSLRFLDTSALQNDAAADPDAITRNTSPGSGDADRRVARRTDGGSASDPQEPPISASDLR